MSPIEGGGHLVRPSSTWNPAHKSGPSAIQEIERSKESANRHALSEHMHHMPRKNAPVGDNHAGMVQQYCLTKTNKPTLKWVKVLEDGKRFAIVGKNGNRVPVKLLDERDNLALFGPVGSFALGVSAPGAPASMLRGSTGAHDVFTAASSDRQPNYDQIFTEIRKQVASNRARLLGGTTPEGDESSSDQGLEGNVTNPISPPANSLPSLSQMVSMSSGLPSTHHASANLRNRESIWSDVHTEVMPSHGGVKDYLPDPYDSDDFGNLSLLPRAAQRDSLKWLNPLHIPMLR